MQNDVTKRKIKMEDISKLIDARQNSITARDL